MLSPIEIIARALISDYQGRILLTRAKRFDHMFLIGGHVEPFESAKNTLVREMEEEVGIVGVEVGDFICAHENVYGEGDRKTHEINLLFHVKLPSETNLAEVKSIEDHIEVRWVSVDDLNKINLQPQSIRPLIPIWLKSHYPQAYHTL